MRESEIDLFDEYAPVTSEVGAAEASGRPTSEEACAGRSTWTFLLNEAESSCDVAAAARATAQLCTLARDDDDWRRVLDLSIRLRHTANLGADAHVAILAWYDEAVAHSKLGDTEVAARCALRARQLAHSTCSSLVPRASLVLGAIWEHAQDADAAYVNYEGVIAAAGHRAGYELLCARAWLGVARTGPQSDDDHHRYHAIERARSIAEAEAHAPLVSACYLALAELAHNAGRSAKTLYFLRKGQLRCAALGRPSLAIARALRELE